MMPEEVAVRYRWTLEEVTVASRWHLRQASRSLGVRVLCWGLATMCGVFATVAYQRKGDVYLALWLGLGAGYFLSLPPLRRWYTLRRMRRNYLKSTGQNAEVEWRITDTLLRLLTPHGSSEIGWTAFNQAVQTPDGVLLYPQPMLFHWWPKAGFAEEADYEQAVQWTRAKVPDFRRMA